MKLVWDFKELTDFGDNLKSLGSAFDSHLEKATQEIARALLEDIKRLTPIDKTGKLISGWNGNSFLVKPTSTGYVVKLVNTTEYAAWVNDGHLAYNQYGGPYPIRKRIKVTSPHKWQKGNPTYYVYGHFFVERGILQFSNTQKAEQIIMQQLKKWWMSV